jgi:hypothetical protein
MEFFVIRSVAAVVAEFCWNNVNLYARESPLRNLI